MVGIVSYGGYIPRLRFDRKTIRQVMGWFSPSIGVNAQGERSMANWDEDTLTMAVSSSQDSLTGMDKKKVDAIYLASTTMPFIDRDNAGVLKSALHLRDDIITADFTSTQKAGTTALITALESVVGGEKGQILVTAAENRRTKSASAQEMCFGDGAGSFLVGRENIIAEYIGSFSVAKDFVGHYRGGETRYDFSWEDRWIRDEGYAKIYPEVISGLLEKTGMHIGEISKLIYPCSFPRFHPSIAQSVGAKPEQVFDSMHKEIGECGTAHPFVMFSRALEDTEQGDKIMVIGYGQGADAILFRVTEKIKNLVPRIGISGYLARKKKEQNYTKWLQFNELMVSELGARADTDNRTALSILWRNRKLILSFVGGRCTACGTPQIPSARVCVNPKCGAIDSQEDYEFAIRRAKVISFTGDFLAPSLDPPAIYGMVQFEGGGRMMMDFSDCDLDEIKVGSPMKPAFRKKYFDKTRGFTGYFWKAVPELVPERSMEGS